MVSLPHPQAFLVPKLQLGNAYWLLLGLKYAFPMRTLGTRQVLDSSAITKRLQFEKDEVFKILQIFQRQQKIQYDIKII